MSTSSTASLLARRQARRAAVPSAPPMQTLDSDPLSSPHSSIEPPGGSSTSHTDSPNPFVTPSFPQSLVPRPHSLPAAHLKAIGERHLKRVKLEPDSEREYRNWLEAPTQDERQCILLLNLLRSQDMQRQSLHQQVETWKPSSALAPRIKQMVRGLLLLPSIRYYSGTVEAAVIAALRDCQVKDLPNEDSFNVDLLKAVVARQFTTDKSELKKLIKDASDSADSDARNVALIANQALSRFCPQLKPSLAVFYRIAYIRRHIDIGHPNGKFWVKVDDELEDLNGGGPAAFVESMDICYEDDVAKYGDPVKTKIKVATDCLGDKPPKWLRVLNSLGPNIQRINTKKRKRAAAAHTEDAEDGDDFNEPGQDDDLSRRGTPSPEDEQATQGDEHD
ncbi:hypothetical protein C8R43DRAFT_1142491 [Mycena crocata]|nr:hypothetical protein C8R43DRAFT_1142491 [Mycena crocata]